jgi:HAD superfamily hydrolase (TIGR01509 family)
MKTILVDAVDTFVIKDLGIYKEMQNLLETYANKKIILTNANDEQFRVFGLDKDMPYEIFTLKHDPDKTDPIYFTKMMQKYGLNKDAVVYFEHNPDAVKSAASVGINSYYYDPEKKDLKALKSFLDQNL